MLIPTLFGISVLTFALMHLVPGDPAAMVGQESDGSVSANVDTSAQIEGFRRRYLFDQPLWKQYLHYIGPFDLSEDGHEWFGGSGRKPYGGVLALDLGTEFLRPQVHVGPELLRRLAITLPMTALAILLAYLLSIPLGIYSAVRSGSALDKGAAILVFALYALPTFWIGLLLQWAFGRTGLDWLPTLGLSSLETEGFSGLDHLLDRLRHLALPICCYTLGSLAYLSRQMRAGMIEVIGEDYIRTARAKGLPEITVITKHAFRNSVLPLVTVFASVLPALVGGS
ncbi:MAG: peptide/nickel transport system permease protein, partial [Planctomycetota bacterium]